MQNATQTAATTRALSEVQTDFTYAIQHNTNGNYVYGFDLFELVFGYVMDTVETAVDNDKVAEALQLINALLFAHEIQYVVTHIVAVTNDVSDMDNLYYVQAL